MLLHPACFPLPIILFLYIQNDGWRRGKGEIEENVKKSLKKRKRNTAMLLRDIIKIPNVVKTRIPPSGGHVV